MKKIALGVIGVVALAGCATEPAPVYNPVLPYDGAAVSSLTVMADPAPERAVGLDIPTDYSALSTTAMNQAMYAVPGISPAAAGAGGLIGVLIVAAVDASVDAARNSRINGFLEQRGIDARVVFSEALQANLAAEGYSVTVGDQPRTGRALFASTQAQAVSTDASIDVLIRYYGLQIVPGRGWAPTAVADVVVREAGTGRILVRDTVVQGMPSPGFASVMSPAYGDAVIVPYDPLLVFESVDDMVDTRPDDGARAMETTLRQVAAGVAMLVRNNARTAAEASAELTVANAAPSATLSEPIQIEQ